MSRNVQMFALPAPPENRLELAGASYRLVKVFKHDFFAATCLYEAEGPARLPKIVAKIGRVQPFCGLPMAWYGRWLQRHERAIYQALADVGGVPQWAGTFGPTGYAIEYIDAKPLDHLPKPPEGFFDRLRAIFDAVHARGVAYCDANKRSNILVTSDGRAYLVDFQIAIRRRDDWPRPLAAIVRRVVAYMVRRDLYHLYKHKRRLAPEELTEAEALLSRQRSGLHALHRKLTTPYRSLRRRFLRKQHAAGRLKSPSEHLEDHHQPEKATWRREADE